MGCDRRLLISGLVIARRCCYWQRAAGRALTVEEEPTPTPPTPTAQPAVAPTLEPTAQPTATPAPSPTPQPTPTPSPTQDPATRLGIKRTPNPDGLPIGVDIGQLAPDFRLETEYGETLVLSDFRGKPVFINFFAVWCGPCRFEMPEIESVYNDLGDELTILTVDVRESVDRVTAYKELLGLTMPTVMDTEREVANAYGVPGLPWTYILDANGVVQFVKLGAFLSRAEIIAALGSVGITEGSEPG